MRNFIPLVVVTNLFLLFTGCAGGSWGTGVKPNTFQEQEGENSADAAAKKLKLKNIFGASRSSECTQAELTADPTHCKSN